jgi:hypothetical protein
MSQIKSLFAAYWPAYWPLIVPTIIVVVLYLSRSARNVAKITLRALSRPLLLLAVIALVYDGTRTLSGHSSIVVTSLGEHWATLAPTSYQNTQTLLRRRVHPAVWDRGLAPILNLPAWVVFGVVGFGLAWAGRRRRETEVFAN